MRIVERTLGMVLVHWASTGEDYPRSTVLSSYSVSEPSHNSWMISLCKVQMLSLQECKRLRSGASIVVLAKVPNEVMAVGSAHQHWFPEE